MQGKGDMLLNSYKTALIISGAQPILGKVGNFSVQKLNKTKYQLLYNDNKKGTQRIIVNNLNSYEEADAHKHYYYHLGYPLEYLEIKLFYIGES